MLQYNLGMDVLTKEREKRLNYSIIRICDIGDSTLRTLRCSGWMVVSKKNML